MMPSSTTPPFFFLRNFFLLPQSAWVPSANNRAGINCPSGCSCDPLLKLHAPLEKAEQEAKRSPLGDGLGRRSHVFNGLCLMTATGPSALS